MEEGLSATKEKLPPEQKNWKKLAKKCCIAMLIVLGIAFVGGTILPKKSNHSNFAPSEGQLKFVAVAHRHGERSP